MATRSVFLNSTAKCCPLASHINDTTMPPTLKHIKTANITHKVCNIIHCTRLDQKVWWMMFPQGDVWYGKTVAGGTYNRNPHRWTYGIFTSQHPQLQYKTACMHVFAAFGMCANTQLCQTWHHSCSSPQKWHCDKENTFQMVSEVVIWKELLILNLFPEVKWLICHFMKETCNVW